jgi:molybdopterin-guanine dinucleotide biosynthesis protein A
MPLVPAALLARLVDAVGAGFPAAIPHAGGRLQPLCGAFTPEAFAPLAAAPDAPR